MKTQFTLLSIAAAACLLAGCNKNAQLPALQASNDNVIDLSVGVSTGIATKATLEGTAAENTVSSVQVFVFKRSGSAYVFEASGKAEGDSPLHLTVTSGDKSVLALVNEPADYTSEKSHDAILAKVTSLKDNSPSSFVMVGETDCKVSATDRSVSVPVDRIAARIRVRKITNELRNGFAGKSVKLLRLYLTGAAARSDYKMSAAGSSLYATRGINSALDLDGTAVSNASEKSAVNALIYNQIGSSVIPESGSYDTPVSLYAYPNGGGVRPTHLVAELEIDGNPYTYPVEIPLLESNSTYEFSELVIRSIGNPSNGDDTIDPGEDDPISSEEVSFSVEVQGWNVHPVSNGDDGNYTI